MYPHIWWLFMSLKTQKKQKWALASILLDDAFTDFILSRQAMLCTPRTVKFYTFTLGKVIEWLKENGVNSPEEITARHVRAYIAEMGAKGLSDSYIHSHARVIRTFTRFLNDENYAPSVIKFTMPTIGKKRLRVLSADELQQVIKTCQLPRDKALILLFADTGIRRGEASLLNWGDVNIERGTIQVKQGKGKKDRTVIIGVTTRRALLAYRRTIVHDDDSPLIQTNKGTRLTAMGIRSALLRIEERSGIRVSPHALRRTFATLSRRAGMDLLELQALMGHASLDMTKRYIEMIEDDLIAAHREHGPIDKFIQNPKC